MLTILDNGLRIEDWPVPLCLVPGQYRRWHTGLSLRGIEATGHHPGRRPR